MRKKIIWGILAIAYVVVVLAGTLFARGRSLQEWVTYLVPPGRIQALLIYPLQHHHPVTFAKLIVLGDILSNIFLFIPLGVIIFLVFDRILLYSQKHVLYIALFTGAIFSTCIELVQYMVPKRIPSVSDVLANTAGVFLGCSFFYIRRRQEKKSLAPEPEPAAASEQKNVSTPQQ
ncbi:MAG: VanZ family protein [bacterium]|nr:VanZ family protein [bacterium]